LEASNGDLAGRKQEYLNPRLDIYGMGIAGMTNAETRRRPRRDHESMGQG